MQDLFLDYELPPQLIAQQPASERDQSRLLVVRRADRSLAHHVFRDLPELLNPKDLLILNNTRVLPARLLGYRERTGGKWEGLFLQEHKGGLWELLSQTRGHLSEGETIVIEPGPLKLMLAGKSAEGRWLVRPNLPGTPTELLAQYGQVPLPPYIRKGRAGESDETRYQTVYAQRDGSVAAPTAGLHFTERVFARLGERGIAHAFVTLHVGLGTFQPIQVDDVTQHKMHREWGELSGGTAEAIAACKGRGGRVVAVGTTSVRVLETAGLEGPLAAWSGETKLFIYSPYRFRIVDALVTNFHLPRTSLLLLVSAFGGVELIEKAYRTAIAEQYRFYSYGDAMLIV
jgi:S-adenosylmethionine:tRNA ribosyltransferase-isomerase